MFTCDLCNDSFMSQQGLNYHIDNNVCRKPNRVCPRCMKCFTTKRSCVHHMEHNICQKNMKNCKSPEIIEKTEIYQKPETPKKIITLKNKINKPKNKRKTIPPYIKPLVWCQYIGETFDGLCYCCGINEITPFDFEIRHVVHERYGGYNTIENLRPVCHSCGVSMSCKNMVEFSRTFYRKNNPAILKELPTLQSDILYEI